MVNAPSASDGTVTAPDKAILGLVGAVMVNVPPADAPGSQLKMFPARLPVAVRLDWLNATPPLAFNVPTGRPSPDSETLFAIVPPRLKVPLLFHEPLTRTVTPNCGTSRSPLNA